MQEVSTSAARFFAAAAGEPLLVLVSLMAVNIVSGSMLKGLSEAGCRITTICKCKGSTRFFSKIASIFKKVLHLKDLNRHLECILMLVSTLKLAPCPEWKSDRQTDRQTK